MGNCNLFLELFYILLVVAFGVYFLIIDLAVLLKLDLLLWQKALLICSLLFIVIMELVNTAVEVVIDRISPDYHELSKKAKDIGSSLVLLAFVNAIILWGAFLYPLFF